MNSLPHRRHRPFDFVFTVCDNAGGGGVPTVARCEPMTAHRGVPDPGRSDRHAGRNRARVQRQHTGCCINASRIFTALPISVARPADAAENKLKDIGRS